MHDLIASRRSAPCLLPIWLPTSSLNVVRRQPGVVQQNRRTVRKIAIGRPPTDRSARVLTLKSNRQGR
jgi:hypothetical protein